VNTDSGSSQPSAVAPGIFATTHWSVVLGALDREPGASSQALEKLCQAYWYPLYAYARRLGQSAADAEDLTQGFFAKLLEKDYLKAAARDKGRFRTFLLTALKRFMANEWDRQHARKRGGFSTVVPIDSTSAEEKYGCEPACDLQPDVLFDRHWALALLEQTMSQLQEEYVASGRAVLFEHLRDCLAQEDVALPYAKIAEHLKSTEAAIKMAMHRFRTRYREVLREQIAQTVTSEAEVEEEVRHLFAAFG
jgi:RNA polymerase sigma-70 factor (ECF subfamily)